MTNELELRPKGFGALSACEIGALSALFKDCRMAVANADVPFGSRLNDNLGRMMADFQWHDPLWGLIEVPPMGPKPHLASVEQWQP